MLSIFGKSQKTPGEVVRNLKDALIQLDKGGEKRVEKNAEEINKWLQTLKGIIYGQDAVEQSTELAQEVYNHNVIPLLIKNLARLDFEAKKDVAQIFNNLLRRQIGTRSPTVEYLSARPDVLFTLLAGYEMAEIAVTSGNMLRECIRHEHLAKVVLLHENFYRLFIYVESSSFDIASDAFATFKDLITKHKSMCSQFLDDQYDRFFGEYQKLLNSENYVTRRQSLKLLGEILLDRHNFNVMTRYISNPENLKLMMELLREKSKSIQFEAFHVFKVFVANPVKPRAIADILLRNRGKLVDFLGAFHNERSADEQFNDEKAYLIKQIQDMKA